MYDGSKGVAEQDPNDMAARIQKTFRGFMSRKRASEAREAELIFIGMKPAPGDSSEQLNKAMREARAKRKILQQEHKENYERSLIDLHKVVLEEEGPEVRERLMQDRKDWFIEQLGRGERPETLEGYVGVQASRRAGVSALD